MAKAVEAVMIGKDGNVVKRTFVNPAHHTYELAVITPPDMHEVVQDFLDDKFLMQCGIAPIVKLPLRIPTRRFERRIRVGDDASTEPFYFVET